MNSQDDSLVYEAIEAGCERAAQIIARLTPTDDDGNLMRRVDRALQRLKRAGSIALIGTPRRWKTTKQIERE